MRYEPGAMALCIDPTAPQQVVTLLKVDGWTFEETAWLVRFPTPIMWPYVWPYEFDGSPSAEGWIAQRYLIPIRPDADPVETETEREIEVVA